MPLLRITCPSDQTDRIVDLLHAHARPREISVVPGASRLTGGDLVLVDLPRAVIDDLLAVLPERANVEGMHVAVQASDTLYPRTAEVDADDEAVIWAQVTDDMHETGRLSWINTLLIVNAAAIASVGIIEDQLLLIVGAMALSPDYYPIADTCLSFLNRNRRGVLMGLRTLAVIFSAGTAGAWVLTELLVELDIVSSTTVPDRQLTLFISQPNQLSVVVAILAGVAGALAITLPNARGIVGVFVSITTIPAAANIGVAFAGGDGSEMAGAAVQLGVNIASLLIAGTITLEARHRIRHRVTGSAGVRRTSKAQRP